MMTLNFGDSQTDLDITLDLNLTLDLWALNAETWALYDRMLTGLQDSGWAALLLLKALR